MEPEVDSLIQRVEDGVAALLEPLKLAGFSFVPEVEVLPENKAGVEEAVQVPRVTVSYMNSTFGAERGESATFFAGLGSPAGQEETLHVAVTIRAKGRAKDRGVYPVLELARRLLLSKAPFPGARGLWFTGQQLDDFEERGNWRYMLTLATSTVITAEAPTEELVQAVVLAWNLPTTP